MSTSTVSWATGMSLPISPLDSSAAHTTPSSPTAHPLRVVGKEITAGHLFLFEDTRYNFLGYAAGPKKRIAYGVGFLQLAAGGIEERDKYNNPGKDISDYHNAYLFSMGYALRYDFSLGMGIKVIQNKFDDINTAGFGADLSLLYSFYRDKFAVGANIQNIIKPEFEKL